MIGDTRAMREALAKFMVELDKVMLTVTDREDHVKGDVNEVRLPDGTVMEEADDTIRSPKGDPRLPEPRVQYATVREAGEDEIHIECRFSNGEKYAAVRVSGGMDQLANEIAAFLSGGETPRDNESRPERRNAALRNALARLYLILDDMDMPYRYEPINDGFVLLAGKAQVRRARKEPSALGPRDLWGWVCRPHESEGLQHQSFNSMVRDLLNHMSISRYSDAPCEVQVCRPFDKVTK